MLVCVFAHPDDEAFGPGGAIARYAQSTEVQIICATNGDADGNSNMGKIRRQELLNSSAILGVKAVHFLDFEDGSLCNGNYHEVANKVKHIIDKIKPDTLMTFDINGVSGHLDHVAMAMITSYLFERLNYPKKLLYFCEKELISKKMAGKYFVYFPPGYEDEQVDIKMDVSDVWKQKLSAMKAHESQKDDCDMILKLFGDHIKTEYFKIWEK